MRGYDSIIIRLINAEGRIGFFTFSSRVPVEQGLPPGYNGLIVMGPETTC